MVINVEKYKNDGWGLSKDCFLDILKILENIESPKIIEFGSGISTQFFIDYLNSTKKDGSVKSFDDNIKFSSKIKDNKLRLEVRSLVECSDENYEQMFENKRYDISKMRYRTDAPHTRQRNCFYEIIDSDFVGEYDIVVLDGPHGNGRNFAFLHILDHLKSGSHVVIDDFNHYDFSERFEKIFDKYKYEKIKEVESEDKNKWNGGGNYKIYKIIETPTK